MIAGSALVTGVAAVMGVVAFTAMSMLTDPPPGSGVALDASEHQTGEYVPQVTPYDPATLFHDASEVDFERIPMVDTTGWRTIADATGAVEVRVPPSWAAYPTPGGLAIKNYGGERNPHTDSHIVSIDIGLTAFEVRLETGTDPVRAFTLEAEGSPPIEVRAFAPGAASVSTLSLVARDWYPAGRHLLAAASMNFDLAAGDLADVLAILDTITVR